MSLRAKVKVATFVILSAMLAPQALAQCSTHAETNIVYVIFKGCDPGDTVPVLIGDEPVVVTRVGKTTVWRGETVDTFTLNERSLRVDDTDIASARFFCRTGAVPRDEGECVAEYRVSCERLWYLDVQKVPETASATINYERKPLQPKVQPCAEVAQPQPNQREIGLAHSESVRVQLDQPKLEFSLDLSWFKTTKERKLFDVLPSARSAFAAIPSNPNMQALKKKQVVDAVTDLLFTRKDY
jgi:hypothetical protein